MSGSSGFVGTTLSNYLTQLGHQVVPYQRNGTHPPQGDFELVIHLAARVHHMTESQDAAAVEKLYQASNVELTRDLLRFATEQKVKRFIFFSSVKALGEGDQSPYLPGASLHPEDAYGRSKAEAETLVRDWSSNTQGKYLILRCPLLYGPGVRANFDKLIRLTRKLPVLPFSGVHNRRSLLALDNLCDLIRFSLTNETIWNHTLHPSDGKPVSLAELTQTIARAANTTAIPLPIPSKIYQWGLGLLGKGAVSRRLLGDLETQDSFLFKEVGWTPPESTLAAVARLVQTMRADSI